MNTLGLQLGLLALLGAPGELSDADLQQRAEAAFRAGIEARSDEALAKKHFQAASEDLDRLWQRGWHSKDIAHDRYRAHLLAGKLPEAIAAIRAAQRIHPTSPGLEKDLETARDLVPYPIVPDASPVRPAKPAGLARRLSDWDLLGLFTFSLLLVCFGLLNRFTTRRAGSMPMILIGGILLSGVVVAWQLRERELREQAAQSLAILRVNTTLRKGNGESYAARIDAILPRGLEVQEITRRGDWSQVRLANGIIGWVPEEALLVPE